jgi:hypothetical protein
MMIPLLERARACAKIKRISRLTRPFVHPLLHSPFVRRKEIHFLPPEFLAFSVSFSLYLFLFFRLRVRAPPVYRITLDNFARCLAKYLNTPPLRPSFGVSRGKRTLCDIYIVYNLGTISCHSGVPGTRFGDRPKECYFWGAYLPSQAHARPRGGSLDSILMQVKKLRS